MADFRITFTIERRGEDDEDFVEVGLGDSGAWSTLDQAVHIADSVLQSRAWETTDGMPDPSEVG